MRTRFIRWLRSVQVPVADQRPGSTPDLKQRYRARRDALLADAGTPRGTRRRMWLIASVGLLALASMFQAVSANVLAVNFTTMNSSFQMYTNYLQGEKVAAYLNTSSRADGAPVPLAELGVKRASLAGLCLIANESILGLGKHALVLTAGEPVSGSFGFQSGVGLSNANYYLPTGWTVGTDVWGTNGNATAGEYPGALKGPRAADAVTATDLFLNTSGLYGAGYKLNGMYLGERAQDVGANADIEWETGAGAPSPGQALTSGGFGLRVDRLNLAGGRLWTDGSPFIPGTPAQPEIPGQPGYNVTVSDGPPVITDLTVNAPGANYANVANDNNYKNQVGRIVDGDLATKWVVSTNNGGTVSKTATVTYTLSQPWKIGSYQIGTGDVGNTQPKAWTLQGSTDNSTWTTLHAVTNADIQTTSWKQFYVSSPGYYKYYRLAITDNEGAAGLQLSEWKLNGIGVIDSSSANPAQDATYVRNNGENYRMLMDGNGGTKLYHNYGERSAGTNGDPSTYNPNFQVVYELVEPAKVVQYSLKAASDAASYAWRNPQRWQVHGSNDRTTWTQLSNVSTNQSFSGNNAVNTYPIANPGSYRYYRLTITQLTEGDRSGTWGFYRFQRQFQLADWMLSTGTTTEWVPPTETVPAVPAGPDTPAIPAGGSAYGIRLKGSIKLPKLKIRVVAGEKSQSYCPTAAAS